MRVKICGITRLEDATHAASCGADFIGLIRAPSPRRVPVETARRIAVTLPDTTNPVLVFRNNGLDEITETLDLTGIRWVQLHGHEPPDFAHELRIRYPDLHLIRAGEIAAAHSAAELHKHLDAARAAEVEFDVILLDVPKNVPHPGHDLLARAAAELAPVAPRIWCAGQLTAENLTTALAGGHFAGVDVAGGVETRPGIKDHAAVERFIATARTHTTGPPADA